MGTDSVVVVVVVEVVVVVVVVEVEVLELVLLLEAEVVVVKVGMVGEVISILEVCIDCEIMGVGTIVVSNSALGIGNSSFCSSVDKGLVVMVVAAAFLSVVVDDAEEDRVLILTALLDSLSSNMLSSGVLLAVIKITSSIGEFTSEGSMVSIAIGI